MDASTRAVATAIALEIAAHPSARTLGLRPSAGLPVAAAALVLAALVPGRLPAQTQPACTATGAELQTVGPIESTDRKLRAVVSIEGGERWIPGNSKPQLVRYYSGHAGHDLAQPATWPPKDQPCAGPGPTLRAQVGDQVQITFLNRVNTADFSDTLDSSERNPPGQGCDQTWMPVNGVRTNLYPKYDKYPNCFHGSSSANIHFHGTHVTPATTGDNVLVNVRPHPLTRDDEKLIERAFGEIFNRCGLRQEPKQWRDLPPDWRQLQQRQLEEYDAAAPFEGGRGLPQEMRLWPKDVKAIDQGQWPQFYSGSYPYCFELPRCPVDQDCGQGLYMGQAPGTHWYHSHKHGSTTLNLFNGLAGALIIEDNSPEGYDGKLRAFYRDRGGERGELVEKVLVIQQLATVVNLTTPSGGGSPKQAVNGQLTPTITMRPGQVQLWRIINASAQASATISFTRTSGAGDITFRQTAQDGVQLAWANYSNADNGKQTIKMAPANRVDLLVQAPLQDGTFALAKLLNVKVAGTPYAQAMGFPASQHEYPTLPKFLADQDPSKYRDHKDIVYGSRTEVEPNPPKPSTAVQFMINDKQFEDHVVDEVMKLDDFWEWTLYNTDALRLISHPFHIHVNPFQIIETFDFTKSQEPVVLKGPYVWWDTFAIPAPGKMASGDKDSDCKSHKIIKVGSDRYCAGYFKMRTRFADFTGEFVDHCHILAHEDRGMMQLIEVVPKTTTLEHH
ncbi:MAG TPA: multicopper oxidase domain-containing protein [Thermoanaerobaculia bacterium]|jgi:FtsP/CotA-like multicopper oxidase with cupredoxin domain|nr:multicopper oxidase domain-containing protein [Thermoanaerobaculia bacterium]